MQLIPSLLFGISASLDALLVGVSFGLRGVHIRPLQNLFISLIALLGTCLSVGLGGLVTPLLPPMMGNCVGSLILMLLGIYYITKWILTALQNQVQDHRSESDPPALISTEQTLPCLTAPQVLLLSLTLTANNLGIGLSASMAGLTLIPAATATCICSVLFLYLGNHLGQCRLLQLIGGLTDPISGLLLVFLSLIQLFF
ncbi:MAG: manganese efflux pump [Acetatifactor sp.]|nr:manganese efflux pump [Acetatifactor sp.]